MHTTAAPAIRAHVVAPHTRCNITVPLKPALFGPMLSPATVNPVAGFGDPIWRRASVMSDPGAFFVPEELPHPLFNGADSLWQIAWGDPRVCRFDSSRFANPARSASIRLATAGGSSLKHFGAAK